MAYQSPMISIPKKTTEDVDWTTPIRHLIAQSYGESPDNYVNECASLQRCRQDAVRGAGSDMTARDLLYKYFGQLELLELRFSEIRVNFPWHDAFTNKLITQTSIAYEKASILFQIAVTHSSIAASQNRSDAEGLKRSFRYFRTCAGMLTYINDNFLHAPSTDLSREVVKFLVNIILAQATEVFFEKCTEEKKGNALVSKIASQAAFIYTSLTEEVKEFMGKGIFDRNWVTLIQIKSKYFQSLAQYYRSLADNSAGKHGDALGRLILAESLVKEASRTASSFSSVFATAVSPNLPPDAGIAIHERVKAHLALCTERTAEAQRENDLIYNAIVPVADALPPIDKTTVATLVPIQEVFGAPEVQKVIGPDIFARLIPLSVHESASVYSEEKAKLVRGEVEKAEAAEGEARSQLDAMGIREGLLRFKAMTETDVIQELPIDVKRWKEDITVMERESVEALVVQLNRLKEKVRQELDAVSKDLDVESKECETMRVKYEHLWTQEPSAAAAKSLRQGLKAHYAALDAAATSDQQVYTLWDSVRDDVALLLSDDIEEVFRASAERTSSRRESLLDLDNEADSADASEKEKIAKQLGEVEERLDRLMKISKERNEVLKDLKDKIQTDDVSHLLLLNRRNTGVEPKLFAAELEKFKPYQQRLASNLQHQQTTLHELNGLWKSLKNDTARGAGARKWDEKEKRKKETVRRFSRARDGYMEVRDALAKGLQFYNDLSELSDDLRQKETSFVSKRKIERDGLASQAEMQKRLAVPKSPPPLAEKPSLPPPPAAPSLDTSFASMSLRSFSLPMHPPASGIAAQHSSTPPSQYPPQQHSQTSTTAPAGFQSPPPPPPPPLPRPQSHPSAPPPGDPYAQLNNMFNGPQPVVAHNTPPTHQTQQAHTYTSSPVQQHQHNVNSPPFSPPPPPGTYNYGAPSQGQRVAYNYGASAQQPQPQQPQSQQPPQQPTAYTPSGYAATPQGGYGQYRPPYGP